MMRIGKFTDFYRDVTKAGTKIPQEKYLKVGHYPVIDQGRQAIVGRWDSDDGICKEIPAIIFGDHTRAIKYIEEPFFIGADGVKILRPVNVQDNPKYLYYALQAARIPNLGYSRHFKALKELDFHVCSIEKQDEIVRILEKIDYLIEQCHEEDSCLNQIVKSRFIELFGDPDVNSKGWNECALSEKLNVVGGYAFKSDQFDEERGIPVLRIGNINAGFFRPVNLVYWHEDESLERYIVYPGELVMSLTGTVGKDDYGNVCILGDDYGKYYLNQRNAKLEIVEGIDKYYLSQLLKFEQIKKRLTGISRGVRQANISNKDILNLVVPVPPMEIQEQFSAFVAQTDKSKYYSQKFLTLCRSAANIYEQEWMKCQTLNF